MVLYIVDSVDQLSSRVKTDCEMVKDKPLAAEASETTFGGARNWIQLTAEATGSKRSLSHFNVNYQMNWYELCRDPFVTDCLDPSISLCRSHCQRTPTCLESLWEIDIAIHTYWITRQCGKSVKVRDCKLRCNEFWRFTYCSIKDIVLVPIIEVCWFTVIQESWINSEPKRSPGNNFFCWQ